MKSSTSADKELSYQTATMRIRQEDFKIYFLEIVLPNNLITRQLKLTNDQLEQPEIKIPSNITVLKVMRNYIINTTLEMNTTLGIDPNNNIEALEVYEHPGGIQAAKFTSSHNNVHHYLADFITNYIPNTKHLNFTKMTNLRPFNINMIPIFDQLEKIDLSGHSLYQSQSQCRLQSISFDRMFFMWLIKKGNCKNLITENCKLTNNQKYMKECKLVDFKVDVNNLLTNLDEELVKFAQEYLNSAFCEAMEKLTLKESQTQNEEVKEQSASDNMDYSNNRDSLGAQYQNNFQDYHE